MKILSLLVISIGISFAEMPTYTGLTTNQSICKKEMEMVENDWKRFWKEIRNPTDKYATTKARSLAFTISQKTWHETDTYFSRYSTCKKVLSKKDYAKWVSTLKKRSEMLKKKGWID